LTGLAPLRVRVWNEGLHEQLDPHVRAIYPDGMHAVIAEALRRHLQAPGLDINETGDEPPVARADGGGQRATVTTATLGDAEHGLSEADLAATDVLLWWGHIAHEQVTDAAAQRVQEAVLAGMGLVVLHSGHFSKPFRALMGTTCSLQWRNAGERELVWTVATAHPVTEGLASPVVIDHQEMYGEPFDVPTPDDVLFISSFAGGEVFRSGMTWTRGRGRVVYLSPGDQDYPVYHHDDMQRMLANAVGWVAPQRPRERPSVGNPPSGWFLTDQD